VHKIIWEHSSAHLRKIILDQSMYLCLRLFKTTILQKCIGLAEKKDLYVRIWKPNSAHVQKINWENDYMYVHNRNWQHSSEHVHTVNIKNFFFLCKALTEAGT
jgi:hypothetical protein